MSIAEAYVLVALSCALAAVTVLVAWLLVVLLPPGWLGRLVSLLWRLGWHRGASGGR
jgi:hypothetical protein